MKSIPYSSLDKNQLTQVEYLFADKRFKTATNTYLYEVDGNGDVKGRVSTEKPSAKSKRARIRPDAKVTCTLAPKAFVTEEMIQRSRMNMDALAAYVAQKIYRRQQNQK